MIALSPRPVDLEMPVDGFVDEITPVDHFFARSHTYIPEVKLQDWKRVAGKESLSTLQRNSNGVPRRLSRRVCGCLANSSLESSFGIGGGACTAR